MKRFICVMLALLLLPGIYAAAEDAPWGSWAMMWRSTYGYTLYYHEDLMRAYTVPEDETKPAMDVMEPVENGEGARLLCYLEIPEEKTDWEAEGWMPLEDEPGFDMDVPYDWEYALYVSEDGGSMQEEIRLNAPGIDYVFRICFPAEDPYCWREAFEDVLASVEFPPQPVETEDFRMDWFQGGAAGMRFIPVTLDEEAQPFVIQPLRDMAAFVLEQVEWDDEALSVIKAVPLYEANPLPTGDNLLVYAYFGDIFPTLRIRYTDAEGRQMTWYLTDSGRDGSLILLGEDWI